MSKQIQLGKDINLVFEVLENTGALLRVRYEAANVSAADLYLFNRLWRKYTEKMVFELDPDMVFVSSKNGTVRLLKGSPDIPDDMAVESPYIPLVTELPRGQRFSETISIPLPLKELNPYKPGSAAVIENPASLVFSLGYFPVPRIGNAPVHNVWTNKGQALSVYLGPIDQWLVSAAPVPFNKTTPPEKKPAGKPKFCSNCGAPIQPNTRFCPQCGAQL
jgi:hypothetical protein